MTLENSIKHIEDLHNCHVELSIANENTQNTNTIIVSAFNRLTIEKIIHIKYVLKQYNYYLVEVVSTDCLELIFWRSEIDEL